MLTYQNRIQKGRLKSMQRMRHQEGDVLTICKAFSVKEMCDHFCDTNPLCIFAKISNCTSYVVVLNADKRATKRL